MNFFRLFNRLIIISERELTIKESLEFELRPIPMALFTENHFMKNTVKAALGNYLKKNAAPHTASDLTINTAIVDGGWLLHLVQWKTDQTYAQLFCNYFRFVKELSASSIAAVVFDGYSSFTKDHEHRRRSKIFSADIEIAEDTFVTVPRSSVLANRRYCSSLTKL